VAAQAQLAQAATAALVHQILIVELPYFMPVAVVVVETLPALQAVAAVQVLVETVMDHRALTTEAVAVAVLATQVELVEMAAPVALELLFLDMQTHSQI
jgi:hypothetical protein